MPKIDTTETKLRRERLSALVADNWIAWTNEEESVQDEHRTLIRALDRVGAATSERRLMDLLAESQAAWEDEEDSVKDEHEELIERNREVLEGIPARVPATSEQIKAGARLWWRDPDNGACSKVGTVVDAFRGDEVLMRDEFGSEFGALAEELFYPAEQVRTSGV